MQPALVTRIYHTADNFHALLLLICCLLKPEKYTIKIIIVWLLLKTINLLSPRNPIYSQEEAIEVSGADLGGLRLHSALLESGFTIIKSSYPKSLFLPCRLGTFSNRLTRGTDGCTNCTPGELYNVF